MMPIIIQQKEGTIVSNRVWAIAAAALVALLMQRSPSPAQAEGELSYETFKAEVEPIFLKKRPGHTRCYVCHEASNKRAFRLEKLAPGAAFWTEEQSRRNFEIVSGLIAPGDQQASLLLMHPLAPEAGGDAYHSGGRQFESKDDPDWQTLAKWASGGK
jgi:hypothetical protein